MNKEENKIFLEVLDIIQNFTKPSIKESKGSKNFPSFLDLRLDAKFISRQESITDKDYKQIIEAAKSIGIDKASDIRQGISQFIDMAKQIQASNTEGKSVPELMNQVRVMRLLYNLVDNASPSSAGILFERLFAILFDLKVEISTQDNIEDVVGPTGSGISLKLISPKTKITGSKKLLNDSGGTVNYIVARKDGDNRLSFYNILISLQDSSEKSLKQKFNVSYFKAAQTGKPVKKDGVTVSADLIGTMDISSVVPASERIAEMVNNKFQSLLKETESLIDAVRDLVGTDKDVKSKAKSAEDKAEKTRTAAEKVRKK